MKKIKIAFIGSVRAFNIKTHGHSFSLSTIEYIHINTHNNKIIDISRLHGIEISGIEVDYLASLTQNFNEAYNIVLSRIK